MYCKNCGKEIGDNSKFCEYCGAMLKSNEIIKPNNASISPQTIIKHLENAGVLEERIYELDNIIKNITYNIKSLQARREVKKEDRENLINFMWLWIFPIAWIIISLGLIFSHEEHPILAMLLIYKSILPFFKQAAVVSLIITAIPISLNFLINLIKNFSTNSKYKNNIKIRDAKYCEDLRKAEMLKVERNKLIQKKKQAKQYLDMVYSKNILFPKYRNMIAVLTIQEYFMSGRCNCLTGHEGAYNIYESELRQNIIINSLEAIQYSLEQIKQNQYMLYQAIQDAQDRIDNLTYEFSNISSNVSSLENNSKVSAYNSKIAADNTRILSYIEMAKL